MPQSVRDRVAYAALFGDPTLVTGNDFWSQVFQLWIPEMCSQPKEPWTRGSIYCGSLGGIYNHRDPYVPSDIALRVGSWCRDDDGVCSGGVALAIQAAQSDGAHFRYFDPDSDSAYAAREAAEALQIFLPSHSADFDVSWSQFVFGATGADLAIVFDTTGSMGGAIGDAKTQATNVAQTWLNFFRNGRVSLVDFKDVNQGDPYVARVDLGLTNDVNAFQTAVNSLTASGGGDYPEAQLSGVMTALDGLDWANDATKVTIVITDAPGKDPEPVTGHTRDSVGQHALEIDPVSVYGVNVSGRSDVTNFMTPLTSATAGQVLVLQPGQTLSDALFDVLDAAHASPVAKLRSPYIAEPGTAITFSAADSFDASADITSYDWDFDGDGTVDRTTTTPDTTYTYPGEFHGTASVRVVASDGRSSIATADVTVDSAGQRDLLPIAPTSVTASITGTNEVTVTWSPAANDRADGYKIFEADGTVVGLKLATETHSKVIGGLDLSQPMTFKVVANNQYGNSTAIESQPVGGQMALAVGRATVGLSQVEVCPDSWPTESAQSQYGEQRWLTVAGSATANDGPVTVDHRVYRVMADGSRGLVVDWTSATPCDGAFDSGAESFGIQDVIIFKNETGYDVDIRATSASGSTIVTIEPVIDVDPPQSALDPLPTSTRDASVTLTGPASDEPAGGLIKVQVLSRFRPSTGSTWGQWSAVGASLSVANPATFAKGFAFPQGNGYYEFYSIATDDVGNVEAPPSVADAAIRKR